MDTNPGTVTVWQSGRLAPRPAPRQFRLTREQWLGAALLLLSAAVLAVFVSVLQREVDRSALARLAQRRGDVTLAGGDVATPGNSASDTAPPQNFPRGDTVSLTSSSR